MKSNKAMEKEASTVVSCNRCNMFVFLPICIKCKLIGLLKENLKSLQAKVATLKLVIPRLIGEYDELLIKAEVCVQTEHNKKEQSRNSKGNGSMSLKGQKSKKAVPATGAEQPISYSPSGRKYADTWRRKWFLWGFIISGDSRSTCCECGCTNPRQQVEICPFSTLQQWPGQPFSECFSECFNSVLFLEDDFSTELSALITSRLNSAWCCSWIYARQSGL